MSAVLFNNIFINNICLLSYLQCINWNAECLLTEERHIHLWGVVTKLPKTRKWLMTNIGLFNSCCCAPTLLLFLWFRGVAFYPGMCWCAFLSHWLHTNSFTCPNCPLNSVRAFPASGCKSWPLALFKWGGLKLVVFLILLYIQESTIHFSVQIHIKTNLKNHIHCTVYF